MIHWAPEYLLLGLAGFIALFVLLPFAIPALAAFARPRTAQIMPTRDPVAELRERPGADFLLRYSAPSYAIFKPGCQIRVVQLALPGGVADVELSTGYLDGWGEMEDGIVAEAKGSAEETARSIASLSDRLDDLAAVISLSANAWVGDLAVSENRNGLPVTVDVTKIRELDEEATGVLLERIGGHTEAVALREALQSYRRALAFWSIDQQPVALGHLHSGLLTMTEVMIRYLAQKRGLQRSGIAKTFGVSPEDLPARILESELYRDDSLCLHASHLGWQVVAGGAALADADRYVVDDAHLSAARYLRAAIFRVLELEPSCYARLVTAPYDTPLGLSKSTFPGRSWRDDRNPLTRAKRRPSLRPGWARN